MHRLEALGYAVVEDERPGRFDPELAAGKGVPAGPQFGRLQRGEQVEAAGGVVQPHDVMGEPRPGRTLVFTGDTEPCQATATVARGADLLVHDGTFADEEAERARQTGHSTARQAAEIASEADVAMLALTHLSSRYFAPVIEKEAREVFERTVVPRDFDVIEVPTPSAGSPSTCAGRTTASARRRSLARRWRSRPDRTRPARSRRSPLVDSRRRFL